MFGVAHEANLQLAAVALTPGTSSGAVELRGAAPGATYSGTLSSKPVVLPATVASAQGVVRFTGLIIPSDFALRAFHHIDVDRSCGRVGSFEACVTGTGTLGTIAACSTTAASKVADRPGTLPRTGWDRLFDVLRVAFLLIGVGALLVYLRRRAVQASPQS